MDEQRNINPEPQSSQPAAPPTGGQPAANFVNEMPSQTLVENSAHAVVAPDAPISTNTYTSFSQQVVSKPKKHSLLFGGIVVVCFALIAIGVLLTTQPNFRAALLMKKYRTYAYTNDGVSYSLNYYKNSKVQKSSTSGSQENVIISPALSNNALPIQLGIDTIPATASQQVIAQAEACTNTGESIAFTVYVPVAGISVNVCGVSLENKLTLYLGAFTNSANGHAYSVTVSQVYNQQEATSNIAYAKQVISKLGLSPYQNDIESFIASINVAK